MALTHEEIVEQRLADIVSKLSDVATALGGINTSLENIAVNTTPETSGTPTAAPAAPVVNTGVV